MLEYATERLAVTAGEQVKLSVDSRMLAVVGIIVMAAACSEADSLTTEGTSPPADGGIDAEAEVPEEVCNFVDDDGDGLVDEGFPWVAAPQRTLLTTTRYSYLRDVVRLPDGNSAVMGADNFGSPGDKIFVAIVSPQAELVRGPVFLPIGDAVNGMGMSLLSSGDLAVIFGSTDWEGCKSGCPTHVTTLRGGDLTTKSDVVLQSDLEIQAPWRLACSADLCVTAVWSFDGRPFGLVWFDAVTGKVTRTMEWGEDVVSGTFVAGDVIAWAATDSAGEPSASRLLFGVRSLDGTREIVPATVLVEGSTIMIPDTGPLVMLGGSVLVNYSLSTEAGRVPSAMIVGLDGTIRTGPAQPYALATPSFGAAADGAPLGGNVMNVTSTKLWRLGPDLEVLNVANNPMSFAFHWPGLYAPVKDGMLLFSATYDGRTVDATRLECFGGQK